MNIINLGIYVIVGNVLITLNYLLWPGEHGVGLSKQVNAGSHLAPVRTELTGPILKELVCLLSMWFNPRAFLTMLKCWPKIGVGFVWVCFECSWWREECPVLPEQNKHCKCQFTPSDRRKFNM